MLKCFGTMFCILMVAGCSVFADSAVWWESENFTKSTFPEANKIEKDLSNTKLSKLKWLSCSVKKPKDDIKDFSAEYVINVPEDGEYTFYAREYLRSLASPWAYRFDTEKWQNVDKSHTFISGTLTNLGPKDVTLLWCRYNTIKLKKGKHKFEIKIFPKENGEFVAGFDLFFLTDTAFTPDISNGWRKPEIMSQYEFITPYIWLEGEASLENNFKDNLKVIPRESDKLSDNKWLLCNLAENNSNTEFKSEWKFTIQMTGTYYLWIRELGKNTESPFSYKINNSYWMESSYKLPSFDYEALTETVSSCWVLYGEVALKEGDNKFKIKFSKPGVNGEIKVAIDSILLIADKNYVPHGKEKPGIAKKIPSDWFACQHTDKVKHDGESLFQKMSLNEKPAGCHGFCKVGKDGFEFEDGTKPKFWGINVYNQLKMNDEYIEKFVENAAARGVNLMRVKGTLCDPNKDKFGKVDKYMLNRLFYFISVCHNHGVYVALANYDPNDYAISSKDKSHPYGMLYYSKRYRTLYKKWAKFLLKENPYNQLSICDDPTVVWFEIQNGDGLLNDNLEQIPAKTKEVFEKQFKKWLLQKYGESSQIIQRWSSPQKLHPITQKDGSTGHYVFRMFPYKEYAKNIILNPRSDYLNKRKKDQLTYVSSKMEKINKQLIKHIKNKCQFKGAVSTGNGKVIDQEIIGAVDTYLKNTGDIVSSTSFVNPLKPENMNKQLLPETTFLKSYSILKNPFRSPIIRPIVKNKATVVSETNWRFPNACRGESVPFIAAYSSLQGHDTYLWYMADDIKWQNAITKNGVQTPAILGQFPGYALMFRRGDIKEGKYILHYQLNYKDILDLKGNGFDLKPLKKQLKLIDIPEYEKESLNPFAFMIGRIDCFFTKNQNYKTFVYEPENLGKYIKKKKGTVKSITKELTLNWKKGQLTINSPKAQAFVGFTGKKMRKSLKDITLSMQNIFGNILVISLDDKPISKSSHILIQAFTKERNTGWKTEKVTEKNFRRLNALGGYPILVSNVRANVQFNSLSTSDAWKIWKLDSDGYRTEELQWTNKDNALLELPEDSMYVELIRK